MTPEKDGNGAWRNVKRLHGRPQPQADCLSRTLQVLSPKAKSLFPAAHRSCRAGPGPVRAGPGLLGAWLSPSQLCLSKALFLRPAARRAAASALPGGGVPKSFWRRRSVRAAGYREDGGSAAPGSADAVVRTRSPRPAAARSGSNGLRPASAGPRPPLRCVVRDQGKARTVGPELPGSGVTHLGTQSLRVHSVLSCKLGLASQITKLKSN